MNPSSPPRQPSKKRAIFILRRPSWSQVLRRRSVGDTDVGRDLKSQIADLEKLLQAYRDGTILETGMI